MTATKTRPAVSRKAPRRYRGYWYCSRRGRYFFTRRGRQIPLTDKCEETKENADRAAKKLAGIKGSSEPNPDLLIGELAQQFLDAKEGKIGADTHEVYGNSINLFLRDFGKVRFDALKGEHIETWADDQTGWSEAYRKGILINLRTMFNWARKTGRTNSSPMAEIVIGKMPRRDYVYDESLPEKIIAEAEAMGSKHFGEFFRAVILTGSRPGELAKLDPQHLEDRGLYILATLDCSAWKNGKKTQKKRTILFFGDAIPLVKAAAKARPNGPLFVSKFRRRYSGRQMWARTLATIRTRLGIENLGNKAVMYACRHTFITRAIRAKIALPLIAQACGTSVQMILSHYSHLLTDDIADGFLASNMFKAG